MQLIHVVERSQRHLYRSWVRPRRGDGGKIYTLVLSGLFFLVCVSRSSRGGGARHGYLTEGGSPAGQGRQLPRWVSGEREKVEISFINGMDDVLLSFGVAVLLFCDFCLLPLVSAWAHGVREAAERGIREASS